jgi:methylenetetrahydrofolate dehydrogenase (NADP+)/methenyltetrahydrofolate cyclohydrolase
MAELIDGKMVSSRLRDELREKLELLNQRHSIRLKLATLLVGNDPASQIYIKNKINACSQIGVESVHIGLSSDISERDLIEKIEELNKREDIDGILVQLPLPQHIDAERIISAISPQKDVDGFHPYNQGILLTAKSYKSLIDSHTPIPCTPYGCMKLLEYYKIGLASKRAVILGRSNIVGKPLAILMLLQDATVTICHSKTNDSRSIIRDADIVVCATGRRGLVNGDMIKEGAVVIDVGINRGEDGKIYGDADFVSVKEKASYITPVPGGVGPMTITMLMYNTFTLGLKRRGISDL